LISKRLSILVPPIVEKLRTLLALRSLDNKTVTEPFGDFKPEREEQFPAPPKESDKAFEQGYEEQFQQGYDEQIPAPPEDSHREFEPEHEEQFPAPPDESYKEYEQGYDEQIPAPPEDSCKEFEPEHEEQFPAPPEESFPYDEDALIPPRRAVNYVNQM
jgi:hypothetical protein